MGNMDKIWEIEHHIEIGVLWVGKGIDLWLIWIYVLYVFLRTLPSSMIQNQNYIITNMLILTWGYKSEKQIKLITSDILLLRLRFVLWNQSNPREQYYATFSLYPRLEFVFALFKFVLTLNRMHLNTHLI